MVMVTVLAMVITRVMTVIMMVMALVRIMMNSAHRAIGTSYANTLRLKEA